MAEEFNYWRRRSFGRRTMLRGAAVGGAGLAGAALIGCGSSGGSSTPAGEGSPAAGATGAEGEQPVVSEAFVAIQTRDAPSLDPMDGQVYTIAERVGLTYPRLVYASREPDDDMAATQWVPSYIVEGWEAADEGAQVTFKLRQGVKYQNIDPLNGREFVSGDVKHSIERYMTDPRSTFSGRYSDIDTIETPDDYTVVFNLKGPSAYFYWAVAAESSLLTPPELLEADGDLKGRAIGPGPFIHEEYLQGEGSTFRKNPDFIDADQIYYDSYLFKVISDSATWQAALKTNQGDFNNSGGLSPSALRTVEGPSVSVYPLPILSGQNLAWNMGNPKWADYRARLAMSKAFDRQAIIDQVYQGAGEWNGIVPVGFGAMALNPDEVQEVNAYIYDPAEAKKLWDAAGAPGTANELYFSPLGTTGGVQGELVAKQWQENLGITTELKTEDYSIFLPNSYNNGYEDLSTVGYILPFWMENLFAPYLPGGTRNGSGINDPEVTAMLDDLRATLDPEEANEKSRTVQRFIQDEKLTMTQFPVAVNSSTYNSKLQNFLPGVYPPGLEWTLKSWKTS